MSDAIKAGAEALEDAAMRLIGRDLGTIHRDRIFQEGLDAATADVEAMARVLAKHVSVECSHSGLGFSDRWWLCQACGWASEKRERLDMAEAFAHQAQAIRDWLLGGEGA